MTALLAALRKPMLLFFKLTLWSALVPAIAWLDTTWFQHGMNEVSLTELMQETLLALCVLTCVYKAVRFEEARGALILAAGFFLCMFFREMNFILSEGLWLVPVVITVLISVTWAWHYRTSAVAGIARYAQSTSCQTFIFGLAMLLIFSRMFGSSHLLWMEVLGPHYMDAFKTVVQEGLELYAYGLISLGILPSTRVDWQTAPAKPARQKMSRMTVGANIEALPEQG